MNEANETYRAASAIAAFDAIQVAFAALVKKGIGLSHVVLMRALKRFEPPPAGFVICVKDFVPCPSGLRGDKSSSN